MHYIEANSYLFVKRTEIHKFKAKISENVATPLCLGDVSKDFSAGSMIRLDLMDIFTILVLVMMQLQLMIHSEFTST